jgi:hypothetical protein
MTPECSRVLDLLGEPLPPDLAAHAATCEDCRALVGGFDALGGGPRAATKAPAAPKLEATRRRTHEELAAQPLPTPWWRELLVLVAVHAVVLVGGVLALGRNGLVLNQASPAVVAGVGLLTLALVGGGAFLALAPTRRRLPWGWVALAALGVALAQVLGGSGVQVRPPMRALMGCMGTEVVLSVVPMAVALVLLSRSAFQPVRALAAGLSSAGVGLLVLHLHCPDGTASHLLGAHVLPWLLLAGAAIFIRSRLPTRSHAP